MPLSGLRILELSEFIAGPYCTKLLADYGADVIKVEGLQGDAARRMGPFPGDIPHLEKSGLFLHLNINKRGIKLNLDAAAGRAILFDLLSVSDILVTGLPPRRLEAVGLTGARLAGIQPSLVTLAITHFGLWGPYQDYEASEIVLYAMGHSMSSTGLPDRPPVKMAGYLMHYKVGSLGAATALASHFSSLETGEGAFIDFSSMEALAGDADRRNTFLTRYQYLGESVPREQQAQTPGVLPIGFYPCKDGWVQCGFTVQNWRRFVALVKRPDLLKDAPFIHPETELLDMRHKAKIESIFYEWLSQLTQREAVEEAQRVEAMLLPVNNIDGALCDEHLRARNFWVQADHPVAGKLTYPGGIFRLGRGGYACRRPAPTLGQHQEEVLCGLLGMTPRDMALLSARGVV